MASQRLMVVKSGGEEAFAEWRACFESLAPGLALRLWDDPAVRPGEVDYALVWDPEPGRLAAMPKLKVVFGSGAGVDGITADPSYPRHVPLVRMSIPAATERMGEYCCWAALSLLKEARRMAIAQAASRWDYFEAPFRACQRTVGIMGLGTMGERSAAMLRGIGFPVIGWSRGRKSIPGVEGFAGAGELEAFLARTDILLCLLPATPETRHIINAATLGKLPRGAGYIGAGRGCSRTWMPSSRRWRTASSAARCWMCSSRNRCRPTTRCGSIRGRSSPPMSPACRRGWNVPPRSPPPSPARSGARRCPTCSTMREATEMPLPPPPVRPDPGHVPDEQEFGGPRRRLPADGVSA